MSGPERLEVDRPPLRRRTGWVVLGVALVLVGGLAVVRAGDLLPDTPSPTASSSARSSPPSASRRVTTGWPTGLGLPPGTLFVLAPDGLHVIDVSGGLVERAALDVDPESAELAPLTDGALVWSRDGRQRAVRLAYAGSDGFPTTGPLHSSNAVLPGPDRTVWVASVDAGHPAATTTWVQADETEALGPRVRVRGKAVADGSGGLFGVTSTAVRHEYPGPARALGAGRVLAVGPDGWLTEGCVGGTCTTTLHDRTTGLDTEVGSSGPSDPLRAAALLEPGSLSAGNRYVAERVVTSAGELVRVRRTGASPAVLRSFPGGEERGSAFTWLSPRWLVATSGDHLVLYDAETDAVVTPSLPFDRPARLVLLPS